MRGLHRALTTLASAAALASAGAGGAHAATVTYVDQGDLYAVPAAGGAPTLVAAKSGGQSYNSVAQSDGGRLVGVRNTPGLISSLSRYTLWESDGRQLNDSPLPPGTGSYTSYLYPIGLDLSADGKLLAYGFSNSYYSNGYHFDAGVYFLGAENYNSLPPVKKDGSQYPEFVGQRLVAGDRGDNVIHVQRDGTGYPATDNMDPWLALDGGLAAGESLSDLELDRDATVVGLAMRTYDSSIKLIAGRGWMVKTTGLMGSVVDDCNLPAAGIVRGVAVSPDGTQVAWIDDAGVKVAGVPKFNGPATCELSAPAVVVGPASASALALGPFTPAAPPAPAAPAPPPGGGAPGAPGPAPAAPGPAGGGGAPAPAAARVKLTLPAALTVARLAAGWPVRITALAGGRATATLKAGSTVLATATGTARAGKRLTLTLRATKAARRRLARSRGRRATLTVRVGRAPKATRMLTLR